MLRAIIESAVNWPNRRRAAC